MLCCRIIKWSPANKMSGQAGQVQGSVQYLGKAGQKGHDEPESIVQKDPPKFIAESIDRTVQVCFSLVFQVLALIRSFYGTSGFSGANLRKTHPINTFAVATMSNAVRLQENIAALSIKLTEEESAYLNLEQEAD